MRNSVSELVEGPVVTWRHISRDTAVPTFAVDVSVHQLIAEQAARTPAAVAIRCADTALTYAELDAAAESLAGRLRRAGAVTDRVVGLHAPRSPEMIVGLLGIMKSGAAALYLDPDLPAARIAHMVDEAATIVIVAPDSHRGPVADLGRPVIAVDVADAIASEGVAYTTAPTDLAYVIYTSGSSGRPKGVMVEHVGLTNYIRWIAAEMSEGRPVNSFLHTSLSFDFSLTSIYTPLVTGGELRIAPASYAVENLVEDLLDPSLDLVRLTPSHIEVLGAIMDGPPSPTGPRVFVVGGEILRGHHVDTLRRLFPHAVIYNHYGPAEAVVGRCCFRLDDIAAAGPVRQPHEPVPVGGPITYTDIVVAHRDAAGSDNGTDGELLIGGIGLARGYVGQPDATARSFVEILGVDGRWYRTGDLVRIDTAGRLVVVGRADDQIKVSGHRVELGEIEAQLRAVDGIQAAAVVMVPGDRQFLCACVRTDGRRLDVENVRRRLADVLPSYMIPARVFEVAEIPLTSRGKLDRTSLIAAARRLLVAPASPGETSADGSSGEQTIEVMCQLWSRMLGVPEVRSTDNFLDLGGDSITAMKIAAACKRLGIRVRSTRILTADTLAETYAGVLAPAPAA